MYMYVQCRSIAELGGCVARLAKRSSEGDEEEENGSDIVGQMEVEIGTDNSGPVKGAQCDERGRGGRRGRGGKGKKSAAVAVEVDGGCLVCRLDNDYQKVGLRVRVCMCAYVIECKGERVVCVRV